MAGPLVIDEVLPVETLDVWVSSEPRLTFDAAGQPVIGLVTRAEEHQGQVLRRSDAGWQVTALPGAATAVVPVVKGDEVHAFVPRSIAGVMGPEHTDHLLLGHVVASVERVPMEVRLADGLDAVTGRSGANLALGRRTEGGWSVVDTGRRDDNSVSVAMLTRLGPVARSEEHDGYALVAAPDRHERLFESAHSEDLAAILIDDTLWWARQQNIGGGPTRSPILLESAGHSAVIATAQADERAATRPRLLGLAEVNGRAVVIWSRVDARVVIPRDCLEHEVRTVPASNPAPCLRWGPPKAPVAGPDLSGSTLMVDQTEIPLDRPLGAAAVTAAVDPQGHLHLVAYERTGPAYRHIEIDLGAD